MTHDEIAAGIGTLDRGLSLLKEIALSDLDAGDLRTVIHHAEDCIGLGNRVLEIVAERRKLLK